MGLYYQDTQRDFLQDVIFFGAQDSSVVDPNNEFVAYDKDSETEGETVSAYGEIIWSITDTLTLTGGARWIDESKDSTFVQPYVWEVLQGVFTQGVVVSADQDFDDVIPEATIRWEVTDTTTLYAAYKEGFKSGGFSNSGILGAISGSVEDFAFDPEEVEGYEGGVKASLFDNTLSLEFEVYYYEFNDLQIDFFNSPTFAFITTNAGSSETKGAEVQAAWAVPNIEGLVLSGSLAYNDGEYTDFVAPCYAGQTPAAGCTIQIPGQVPQQQLKGTDRALAPEWSGRFGADYNRSIGNGLMLGLTLNVQYKDDHLLNAFGNPHDLQESYWLYDAAARFGAESGRWQVAVIGKNLSDEYGIISSGDTPSTGGRTGQPDGFVADRSGTVILPRTVELELRIAL